MVEGHQCHRVGHAHRKQLLGKRFTAQSPNGRFTEGIAATPCCKIRRQVLPTGACAGVHSQPAQKAVQPASLERIVAYNVSHVPAGAQAINQQPLTRIEVHGKNLFYFFGEANATVVLHIHFGMSGAFKTIARGDTLPEPKETTRLVLIGDEIVGQLSAMIVQHGGLGEQAEQHSHTAQRVERLLTLLLHALTHPPVRLQWRLSRQAG